MSGPTDVTLELSLDSEGPAAPPRDNGELVFEAPWQGRVFGLTLALCEQGAFDWEEFRDLLIEEIAAWEAAHTEGEPYHYYERWLAALERLLDGKQLCPRADLDTRTHAFEARPHGHDHHHHDH